MGSKTNRPKPPAIFADPTNTRFEPAPEVQEWVNNTFIDENGPLFNEEHIHLQNADICFLWAPGAFAKQGRTVLGQAEQVKFMCSPWQKWRQEQQMKEWFGHVPAFLITLDARYCMICEDDEFCALVEHELYHIAQAKDAFGGPAFTKTGLPKLEMRSHDVEEFVGVVRRYGVGHPEGRLAQLVEAANKGAEISQISVANACGTCLLKVV